MNYEEPPLAVAPDACARRRAQPSVKWNSEVCHAAKYGGSDMPAIQRLDWSCAVRWLVKEGIFILRAQQQGACLVGVRAAFLRSSVLEEGWLPVSKGWSMKPDHAHFPAHDDVLLALSENARSLRAGSLPLPKALAKLRALKARRSIALGPPAHSEDL